MITELGTGVVSWSASRDEMPHATEQLTLSQDAQPFLGAIEELTTLWQQLESPTERCRALVTGAANATSYVSMVRHRVAHQHPLDDTGDEDLEDQVGGEFKQATDPRDGHTHKLVIDHAPGNEPDTSPEQLQAQAIMDSLDDRLERIYRQVSQAGRDAQGLWAEPYQGPEGPDITPMPAYNRAAWLAGNAAALLFHLEQVNNPDRTPDQRGGHQLAAWPSHHNLLSQAGGSYQKLLQGRMGRPATSAPCPGLDLAEESAGRAIELLTQLDTIFNMEDATPVSITERAMAARHPRSMEFMIGQTSLQGADSGTELDWAEEDKPGNALVYYRHQGVQYVKTLAESYIHPISTEQVLGHCHDIETDPVNLIANLEEEEGGPAPGPGIFEIIEQNRGMALAGLQTAPASQIQFLSDMLRKTVASSAVHRRFMAALAQGWDGAERRLKEDLQPPANPFNGEQTRRVFQAPAEAGADEKALIALADRLDLFPVDRKECGVAAGGKVPWPHAQSLLLIAFDTLWETGDPWHAAAVALGWTANHRYVTTLAEEIKQIR